MIFKLKCKRCGTIIFYDTDEKYDEYQKCDECGQVIGMNIETKLENVADMEAFELLEVCRDFSTNVLKSDLREIETIFDNAKEDKKMVVANIIDKLYLILNRDSDETYRDIEKMLSDYFFSTGNKGQIL